MQIDLSHPALHRHGTLEDIGLLKTLVEAVLGLCRLSISAALVCADYPRASEEFV
jgi:hypothetical protein